ncbi:hypothetical protein N9740_06670 [Pseudomonadales bacterium]|nr:hypothetical protein [Pseudomonadales bacterium]
MMINLDKQHLELIGSRILSELNDLKRTVESASHELDIPFESMKSAVQGELSFQEVIEVLFKLEQSYPIDASDILMAKNDCPEGVKVMKASESKKSGRVFSRENRDNKLTPYYEYRDTAMSNGSMLRPEWIEQLRVVNDNDPCNPDVRYNNGHLMHQVTFFIGPVNFYYEIEGIKYCQKMNTGDSNYITPFVKHSFASRNIKEQALIIACTFGGEVCGAQKEIYNLGLDRVREFQLPIQQKNHSIQKLIRQHLANESLTTNILQEKIRESGVDLDLSVILSSNHEINYQQLCDLSKLLNVEPYDLMMPEYSPKEAVVITQSNTKDSYYYPSNQNKLYKIQTLARTSKMPNTKSFDIEVFSSTYAEKNLWKSSLHQYVYNYSDYPVEIIWHQNSKKLRTIIEPGDSCYIQPGILHSYVNVSSARGRLLNVRIAGAITVGVQREISALTQIDRVALETKPWFDPKAKNSKK